MPDAFTFDEGNGNVRTFKSRAEMYDYMATSGHVVMDGDNAARFKAHCDKKAKDSPAHAAAAKRVNDAA